MPIDKFKELTRKAASNSNAIVETLHLYFTKYLGPFVGFLAPAWWWLAGKYKTWFISLSYKNGEYSAVRGARALAILSGATVLTLYLNVMHILPGIYRFSYDAIVFEGLSYKTEPMYFSKPEWLNGDGMGHQDDHLSTFGCDARPCTDENSREYRFRDSLYLDIKYWFTRLEPYDHSDIAGIMQSELNYCSVEAYGQRNKLFGWHPFIYSIECFDMPNTKGEINE